MTTGQSVVIIYNMEAQKLLDETYQLSETSFAELVIWSVISPVAGSHHELKYRLAYVADGVCVMRFDNEAGKGDHIHVAGKEYDYEFVSIDQLLVDFWTKVDELETGR